MCVCVCARARLRVRVYKFAIREKNKKGKFDEIVLLFIRTVAFGKVSLTILKQWTLTLIK